MAIGNAPWPIGVTMVGIHARTGREKIFSQQIAHVLNDETQRKYIQVYILIVISTLYPPQNETLIFIARVCDSKGSVHSVCLPPSIFDVLNDLSIF